MFARQYMDFSKYMGGGLQARNAAFFVVRFFDSVVQ